MNRKNVRYLLRWCLALLASFSFPVVCYLVIGTRWTQENVIIYLGRTSFSEPARMSTSSKPLVGKLAQVIVGPYRLLGRERGVQYINGFLVSKETVVLRRWGRSQQKFGFIKRVDKGWITTVKDLESWRFER